MWPTSTTANRCSTPSSRACPTPCSPPTPWPVRASADNTRVPTHDPTPSQVCAGYSVPGLRPASSKIDKPCSPKLTPRPPWRAGVDPAVPPHTGPPQPPPQPPPRPSAGQPQAGPSPCCPVPCCLALCCRACSARPRPPPWATAWPAPVLLAAAQAGPTTVAVGERGLVLLSADPARSWRQAQVPVSVTLTAVRFADERHGIAVGHAGVVLSTDNGGQSWQQRLNGRQIAQALLDEARVAQQTRPQPGLLAQAERLVQDGADKPLLDVALLSPRRALAVGAYGLAMASDDGGQHWAPWSARLDNPKGLHLYAVRHQGSAILLVGEQGLLLYSSDDGAHFQRLPSPYAGSFFTAEMLSPTEFMVAGLRGQIWHTRADGQLWWVNQAGLLLQLHNGALQPVNAQPLAPLSGVLPLAGGRWLTLGFQGAQLLAPDGALLPRPVSEPASQRSTQAATPPATHAATAPVATARATTSTPAGAQP